MKKYLFIALLVGFAIGNTKVLKIETQHKTFSKGELKSIVGNKVLYQAKNQLFKKGHIDSISIATINTIIFAPSNIETLLSSLLDFSVLGVGSSSAFYYGWYGNQLTFGAGINTLIFTIAAIYYKTLLFKKNIIKMDNWNESDKVIQLEKRLITN